MKGKLVIFGVAECSFQWDWKFLYHLSLELNFFKSYITLMFYHISTLFSIGGKFLILHFFPVNLMVMVALTHIVEPFAWLINVLIMIIPEDLTVNKNNSVQNMIHKPENPRFTLPWEASFWGGNYVIFGVAGSILRRDCKFLRHLSLDAYFLNS